MKEHIYKNYSIVKHEAGYYITTPRGGQIGIRDEAGVWNPRYFDTLKNAKAHIDSRDDEECYTSFWDV